MMILLAVLALVVVQALAAEPVGRLLDRDDDPDRASSWASTCGSCVPAGCPRCR